jgi:transposase
MRTKADARRLEVVTQADLKKIVVEAMRGGMTQTGVASTIGVSLRALSKWMELFREAGERALKPGKRGRRPCGGRLDGRQAARIRELFVSRTSNQFAMQLYLWTRESIASLIERECGVTVSPAAARCYLKAWGMGTHIPVRRADERNDAAIALRLNEVYPKHVMEAKQESATSHWGDEMGLRSAHAIGKSFTTTGQTSVVRATG